MIRILVINPNSTVQMTESVKSVLDDCTPPNVQLEYLTCPPEGPKAIECVSDGVRSAAVLMKYFEDHPPQVDAFLVSCYSDHPLVTTLRETYRKPCTGIMQASILTALSLGRKVSVVTTTKRYEPLLTDGIHAMGISDSVFAGIASTGLAPLELDSKPRAEVDALLARTALRAVNEMGADVICLGCAGMTHMAHVLEKAVGPNIPIIDGTKAGVELLASLVRMNLFTSKQGVYQAVGSD
ncbi:Hydantoin racemase family protein [Schizosaccharomyces pombe]|uniref:Uncharacterized protein C1F7.10 n=1 Tax=Schizosaccharomyces pombe (strain 972 / ATCC 24843) TaxID=284812 RepID=YAKA_SCHPO|nr:putative hydantoin racemase family protein [Schizosaccharomyces pombe]Q09921.1 RecName: Full=Uncharacterized protein C1F7.10 [Schizosaccharomyces pombe 972h-]CAA91957.1 hydantoin racemase family (predicted) [Schizosaccharomyces pombe]|eukprot:NP_594496.1 putative hydantoin racemase family protein [Schizosaccharomyces pombe]